LTATVARRADERARERARRQRDLEATAAVGQVTSATLDIANLAQQVTDLIRERFGLYFVGLFLMNESRTRAVLQSGTGEAGASLLARGYRVAPGEGVIGVCIADGASHWNLELTMDSANSVPELPYARAEVALPLRSRGEVLGAFWALSYHTETFDDEMRIVLQTIADQVAVAVDSIRLFTERQEATVRLQRAYGEATRGAWEDLMRTRNLLGAGYESRVAGVVKLAPAEPEAWRIEAREAWAEGTPTLGAVDRVGDLQEQSLAIRSSRGVRSLGSWMWRGRDFGEWTPEEQAHLESLTSNWGGDGKRAAYEDAQERAVRQRLMSDISSRIRLR
jgi:putative methionine-R-sulfoxide reductase with GAF domain